MLRGNSVCLHTQIPNTHSAGLVTHIWEHASKRLNAARSLLEEAEEEKHSSQYGLASIFIGPSLLEEKKMPPKVGECQWARIC